MVKAKKGTKLVGYLRVSSDHQARSGAGVAAQRSAIEAAAEREGWAIAAWETDEGETGKHTDRPGFRRALQMVADGEVDGLVAAKLDRLARSVIDFAELLAWFSDGERTLVVLDPALDTSSPSGRLVANVFAAVAQWEAEVIAERTTAALQAKRAAGQAVGRPAVSTGVANRIRKMREKGMTLAAIASRLNDDGVPTARGGATWRPSSVQVALGYKRPTTSRRRADLPVVKRRRPRQAALG